MMNQKRDKKNRPAHKDGASAGPSRREKTAAPVVQDAAFFRDLVDHNPDMLVCVGADGAIFYANTLAIETLGFRREEFEGADFVTLLDDTSQGVFFALIRSISDGKRVAPVELTLFDAHNAPRTVHLNLNGRGVGTDNTWFCVMLREVGHPQLDEAPAARPRILVVEDDLVSARMLQRMLEGGGYETDRAATAAEALEMLEARYYDAMTLDLMLPDRDGLDLLREIRAQEDTEDLPVIVVSASADEARDAITGDAAHVVDWLNKPLDTRTLRATLSHAVNVDAGELPQVLHVEGDSEFSSQVGQTLADIAIIDRAETLGEARKMLQDNDDYDLVLLGLMLPDGLGAELLPFLNRPRGRSVPVILVSSDEAGDSLSSHVADTLNKSHTTQQQMLDTIRAHLRPSSQLDANH